MCTTDRVFNSNTRRSRLACDTQQTQVWAAGRNSGFYVFGAKTWQLEQGWRRIWATEQSSQNSPRKSSISLTGLPGVAEGCCGVLLLPAAPSPPLALIAVCKWCVTSRNPSNPKNQQRRTKHFVASRAEEGQKTTLGASKRPPKPVFLKWGSVFFQTWGIGLEEQEIMLDLYYPWGLAEIGAITERRIGLDFFGCAFELGVFGGL